MSVENFESSVSGRYLYFQRVDAYRDFPGADQADGEQLPSDRSGNAAARFMKRPEHTAENYYDVARARTYATCFSTENSAHIWQNYGNQPESAGKVALVFHFGKLRAGLNEFFGNEAGGTRLMCGDLPCHQIFSINFGLVNYVQRELYRLNDETLPNPIEYAYLKDKQFAGENELRISLSAQGVGRFSFDNGSILEFPPSM